MNKDEFKDRLFDVLNDTNNLPIYDIVVKDKEDTIDVYLIDGTKYSVYIE